MFLINDISLFIPSSIILSASTRKLYEKKLQKLLDNGPAQPLLPEVVPAEINAHHNGNSDPDLYSDKEDGKNSSLPSLRNHV